jgi:hypothetical protein
MAVMVNESFRHRPNRENFAGSLVNQVQIAARANRRHRLNALKNLNN